MRTLTVLDLNDNEEQFEIEDFSSIALEDGFLRITLFDDVLGKISRIYRNTTLIDSFWIK